MHIIMHICFYKHIKDGGNLETTNSCTLPSIQSQYSLAACDRLKGVSAGYVRSISALLFNGDDFKDFESRLCKVQSLSLLLGCVFKQPPLGKQVSTVTNPPPPTHTHMPKQTRTCKNQNTTKQCCCIYNLRTVISKHVI